MPRPAKIYATAVEVHCPDCNEPIAEPHSGSFMWETIDAAFHSQTPKIVTCSFCTKTFSLKLPKAFGKGV